MKSLLSKFCAFKFFDELLLIYPLYVVMFGDFDVSPFLISVLLFVWHMVAFSLEVPSGVWADRYSRKWLLIYGQLIKAAGCIIWMLFPNFTGFLIGFVLWGIESAMGSGTYEALLYDELKAKKKEKNYTKILGLSKTFGLVGNIIALFTGSMVLLFGGYSLVLMLSVLVIFLSIVAIALVPETKNYNKLAEQHYFKHLKGGVAVVMNNKLILSILTFSGLFVGIGAIDEYWGVFATEIGFPKYAVGIVFGGIMTAQAIGNVLAHRLDTLSWSGLLTLGAVSGGLLTTASILYSMYSTFILLIGFGLIFQITMILLNGKLHKAIPSEVRATVGSLESFSQNIVASLMFLAVGGIAGLFSYQISFLFFGVLTLFLSFSYMYFNKNIQTA